MIEVGIWTLLVAAGAAILAGLGAATVITMLVHRLSTLRKGIRERDDFMASRIAKAVDALQAMRDDLTEKTARERDFAKRHTRDWLQVVTQIEALDLGMRTAHRLLERVVAELREANTRPTMQRGVPLDQSPDFVATRPVPIDDSERKR